MVDVVAGTMDGESLSLELTGSGLTETVSAERATEVDRKQIELAKRIRQTPLKGTFMIENFS